MRGTPSTTTKYTPFENSKILLNNLDLGKVSCLRLFFMGLPMSQLLKKFLFLSHLQKVQS
jgi:hypothetical protein